MKRHGGVDYIVPSHPHFYSSVVDWASVFCATVLIHEVCCACMPLEQAGLAIGTSACNAMCSTKAAARLKRSLCHEQFDKQWVMRPDPRIQYWTGDRHELQEGITIQRYGSYSRLTLLLSRAASVVIPK